MTLENIFTKKRDKIRSLWLQAVMESYPADAQRFLKKQKDQFANPVGSTLTTEMDALLGCLLQDATPENYRPILDRILRMRAVQDFTPSESLSFLLELKNILRESAAEEPAGQELLDGLKAFNDRIDRMMLTAFDVYSDCKETLWKLKTREMSRQVSGLLRRSDLTCDIPPWDSEPEGGNKK